MACFTSGSRWYAVAQQIVISNSMEQKLRYRRRFRRQRQCALHIDRHDDFLHRLTNFDQLRRAGFWMRLKLAALGAIVGLVVLIDVASKAGFAAVNNKANVATHAPTRNSSPWHDPACGNSCPDWQDSTASRRPSS